MIPEPLRSSNLWWHHQEREEALAKCALLAPEEARAILGSLAAAPGMSEGDEASGLLGLVDANVGRFLAPEVALELRKLRLRCERRNRSLLRNVLPVILAFDAADIPAMPLKGICLALDYYGHLDLRPMVDADLLVPRDRAVEAIEILERSGWHRGNSVRTPQAHVARQHSLLFGNSEGALLDLHWESLWCSCNTAFDRELWQASRAGILDGAPVRIPEAADVLTHVCVHGVRAGIRPYCSVPKRFYMALADAATVIASDPLLDWDRVWRMSRNLNATMQVAAALSYLKRELRCPVPQEICARIESHVPSELEKLHFYMSMRNGLPGFAAKPVRKLSEAMKRIRRDRGIGQEGCGVRSLISRVIGEQRSDPDWKPEDTAALNLWGITWDAPFRGSSPRSGDALASAGRTPEMIQPEQSKSLERQIGKIAAQLARISKMFEREFGLAGDSALRELDRGARERLDPSIEPSLDSAAFAPPATPFEARMLKAQRILARQVCKVAAKNPGSSAGQVLERAVGAAMAALRMAA